MNPRPALRAASLRLLTASLLSSACGCAEPASPAPSSAGDDHAAGSGTSGSSAPSDDPAEPPPPERLSADVFVDTESGAHISVVVSTAGDAWTISGVRADNTRAHPVTRTITLTDAERQDYARLMRALDDMPRCEPMGRREGEPTFQLRFRSAHGADLDVTEPCLWLRADPPAEAALAEPCLGFVRIAEFIYRTWVSRYPEA